jgi:hypothetical protein
MRAFWAAVSAENGGSGGRLMGILSVDRAPASSRIIASVAGRIPHRRGNVRLAARSA